LTRRSKLEIWLNVLDIIHEGESKPTRIMYEANISWDPLKRVLRSLVSQGLIREIETWTTRKYDRRTKKHYEITKKGENVIRYFKRAEILLEFEETSIIRL